MKTKKSHFEQMASMMKMTQLQYVADLETQVQSPTRGFSLRDNSRDVNVTSFVLCFGDLHFFFFFSSFFLIIYFGWSNCEIVIRPDASLRS